MKNEEFLGRAKRQSRAATAIMESMKKMARRMWMLAGAAFFILHSSFFISCSEEEAEVSEFENWAARNAAFFATLDDSLSNRDYQWQRFLNYSLNPANVYDADKYIYVKKITEGDGGDSPCFTDSVRVIYQGRLIPTATYPEGKVFDGTVYGKFDIATGYTVKQLVSSTVDGYATALQHMHRGDQWRVFIPSELAYGPNDNVSNGVITMYGGSVLIFDLILVDFSPAGEEMPEWSSRQR